MSGIFRKGLRVFSSKARQAKQRQQLIATAFKSQDGELRLERESRRPSVATFALSFFRSGSREGLSQPVDRDGILEVRSGASSVLDTSHHFEGPDWLDPVIELSQKVLRFHQALPRLREIEQRKGEKEFFTLAYSLATRQLSCGDPTPHLEPAINVVFSGMRYFAPNDSFSLGNNLSRPLTYRRFVAVRSLFDWAEIEKQNGNFRFSDKLDFLEE